jgi:hypothetical protein
MHPTRGTRIHPKELHSPLEGQPPHGETGANSGSICRKRCSTSFLKPLFFEHGREAHSTKCVEGASQEISLARGWLLSDLAGSPKGADPAFGHLFPTWWTEVGDVEVACSLSCARGSRKPGYSDPFLTLRPYNGSPIGSRRRTRPRCQRIRRGPRLRSTGLGRAGIGRAARPSPNRHSSRDFTRSGSAGSCDRPSSSRWPACRG